MSKLFKQQAAYLQAANKKHTAKLLQMSFDGITPPDGCVAAWRSNRFMVQMYVEKDGAKRLSVSRTMIDVVTGRWIDGITWEELQRIKSELGFGHMDAVEVYPRDQDVVNVANMRHIWLLDAPLSFAWRQNKE